MRRTPRAWAAAVILVVLALSGCGRVTADFAVHEDGSYDLTVVVAASEDALASAGQTPESFTRLLTNQFASQPGLEAFTVTAYQQDGFAGVEITGENVPGDDAGLFGRGVVSTDSDGVHFDLQYPVAPVTQSFTPAETEAVEIRTTVTFPSTVTDHNGTLVDDTTVEWTGNASTDLDYTATSAPVGGSVAESADGGSGWIAALALAVGVLVVAGLGAWLILRNRTDDGQGRPGDPGA